MDANVFSPRVSHYANRFEDTQPEPAPLGTLVGAKQAGNASGSGAVQLGVAESPYGGPGLVPGVPTTQQTDAPIITQMPPDSLLQDRPLHGGLTTLTAFGEYKPLPPNQGGFQVLAGRQPQALVFGEKMGPNSVASDATWREAPPVLDLCRKTTVELDAPGLQS